MHQIWFLLQKRRISRLKIATSFKDCKGSKLMKEQLIGVQNGSAPVPPIMPLTVL